MVLNFRHHQGIERLFDCLISKGVILVAWDVVYLRFEAAMPLYGHEMSTN